MSRDLFRDRPADVAAQQLAIVLMWLAECQLATLEGMRGLKRTSKYELGRQASICDQAIYHLADLNVEPDQRGLRGYVCPRVRDRLIAEYSKRDGAPHAQ
jgi:hypothetical protein